MSASVLFDLAFLVSVPFWALMILAPTWSVTRRVLATPWVVAPTLVFWVLAALPVFGPLWSLVTQPTMEAMRGLMTRPEAVAAVWAQVIAWDLFLGRWIYLDSRRRRAHPLLMAPILVFTILLSPLAFPLYLVLRHAFPVRTAAPAGPGEEAGPAVPGGSPAR